MPPSERREDFSGEKWNKIREEKKSKGGKGKKTDK
jgi:hypothetical protein